MPSQLRSRARRWLRGALFLVVVVMCALPLSGCGEPASDDATLPPATVIRATEPVPTQAVPPSVTPLPQPPALPLDSKQPEDYPYPNPHLGTGAGTVYPTPTPGEYPTP